MKQIYMILVACLLGFSCSKNKDSEPPVVGYFAKTIQIGLGEGEMKFDLQYDDRNLLVQENITFGTDDINLRYGYNNAGQLTKVWLDDELYGTFEYEGNILTKMMVPASGTDPERTYPVTYTDGTYQTMGGSIRFTVDDKQQLLHDASINIRYTYTNNAGVHKHLSTQPVWFMGDLGSFSFYSLMVSQHEIATVNMRGDVYSVRNKRDAQGNIIQVEMVEEATGVVGSTWDITYEQRILTE